MAGGVTDQLEALHDLVRKARLPDAVLGLLDAERADGLGLPGGARGPRVGVVLLAVVAGAGEAARHGDALVLEHLRLQLLHALLQPRHL